MPLNIPALERIAVWLESGAPEMDARGLTFDMASTLGVMVTDNATPENWCGTTCCIAGAAVAFGQPEYVAGEIRLAAQDPSYIGEVEDVDVLDRAQTLLGLDQDTSTTLFIPEKSDLGGDHSLEDITPAWAARTIRHLIATGEVNWIATAWPA